MESVERILKLFPAVLAGGLALVYVLGAIATGSEFEGAGIDPRDAVPLLSLEQLLARGIGVLVEPATFALVASLLIFVANPILVHFLYEHFKSFEARRGSTGLVKRAKRAMLALLLVSFLVVLLVVPADQVFGLAIILFGLFIPLLAVTVGPEGERPWRPKFLAAALGAFVIGLGVLAYTDPAPSTRAWLDLKDSPGRSGILITHSNSTWYIFQGATEQIHAYPDDTVDVAVVDKRPNGESNDDPKVISYIWDGLESVSPF